MYNHYHYLVLKHLYQPYVKPVGPKPRLISPASPCICLTCIYHTILYVLFSVSPL